MSRKMESELNCAAVPCLSMRGRQWGILDTWRGWMRGAGIVEKKYYQASHLSSERLLLRPFMTLLDALDCVIVRGGSGAD